MSQIDPAYRFVVVYKDGRQMSQEDENGVVVRDHCHVEDWNNVTIYALHNRPKDHIVTVNFETGDFSINNQVITMMLRDMDMYMFPYHEKAVFKPLYGRRVFTGELGEQVFFFCGYEAVLGNKKFKRAIYVSEHGKIFLESEDK